MTPLVAKAARTALEVGVRDVRNQGVLMRGVNATTPDLLDLCFALQGEASILPYYFYMCDMIPNAEHWRVSVAHAQMLQHDMMGYLPGYATPRIICDVPFVGKRWVHMLNEYDTERGISYWTKNYRTSIEMDDAEALSRRYEFYDPIDTLPQIRPGLVAQEAGGRVGRVIQQALVGTPSVVGADQGLFVCRFSAHRLRGSGGQSVAGSGP